MCPSDCCVGFASIFRKNGPYWTMKKRLSILTLQQSSSIRLARSSLLRLQMEESSASLRNIMPPPSSTANENDTHSSSRSGRPQRSTSSVGTTPGSTHNRQRHSVTPGTINSSAGRSGGSSSGGSSRPGQLCSRVEVELSAVWVISGTLSDTPGLF